MRFSLLAIALLCGHLPITFASITPEEKQLAQRRWNSDPLDRGLEARETPRNCTPQLTRIRQEWRTLSKGQKTNYINAVLCLHEKPSTSYTNITGVRSRYDEFQYLHIKQTYLIHFNAPFLGWHRWFIRTFEKALEEECGYRGSLPYWNWFLDGRNLSASPLLNGSPLSFGGDGVYIPPPPNRFAVIDLAPVINTIWNLTTLEGTGGGCVTTGPFAGWTVPFGPVGPNLTDSMRDNLVNLIRYRPHCLSRSFRPKTAAYSFNQVSQDAILQSPNITEFNQRLTFIINPTVPTILNLHGKGHQVLGGEMGDVYSSPGDPLFYLHHAQVDRIWAIWQAQDPSTRQYAISGTRDIVPTPSSSIFQLSDTIDLEELSPQGPRPIRDFLNTKAGPFCYEYV
ncbi:hypothetical protein MMC31_000616 [Peltigera leucophlebia]|nr:hypothetical protein [Peltigera leucophlebia]